MRLVWLTSTTGRMNPLDFLILSVQDMILFAVVDDLFPLSVAVQFGEVDPVIRQREMRGKISAFVFESFLLRFESGNVAVCIFESVEYTRIEAKLRDGVVRIRNQDAGDVLVPFITPDPATVA